MPDNKKVAAVMAAVNAYIEKEEASVAILPQKPVAVASMWQASGRQEIMQMSNLWQRRIVPLR